MITIKVQMEPKKEEAFIKIVGAHGGPMNAFMLPYLNAIAEGRLVMAPHFSAPTPPKKDPS